MSLPLPPPPPHPPLPPKKIIPLGRTDYPGTWSPRMDCPGSHFLKFPGALPSPGAGCPGAWFLRADCPGYNSPGTQPLVALSPVALPWLIPLWFIPLGLIPLGLIPLGLIPLGVIPLGLIPLWDIPLGLIPLWVIPLGLILLGVITLGLIPLGLIPLRAYSSVALSPMAYPLELLLCKTYVMLPMVSLSSAYIPLKLSLNFRLTVKASVTSLF